MLSSPGWCWGFDGQVLTSKPAQLKAIDRIKYMIVHKEILHPAQCCANRPVFNPRFNCSALRHLGTTGKQVKER
jgi:hypothetical protein